MTKQLINENGKIIVKEGSSTQLFFDVIQKILEKKVDGYGGPGTDAKGVNNTLMVLTEAARALEMHLDDLLDYVENYAEPEDISEKDVAKFSKIINNKIKAIKVVKG